MLQLRNVVYWKVPARPLCLSLVHSAEGQHLQTMKSILFCRRNSQRRHPLVVVATEKTRTMVQMTMYFQLLWLGLDHRGRRADAAEQKSPAAPSLLAMKAVVDDQVFMVRRKSLPRDEIL